VLFGVLLAIVVQDLLSRTDGAGRKDVNALLIDDCLGIWAARMIDISCLIDARLAVYGFLLGYLEKIFTAGCLRFLLRYFPAHVFDDAGILRDGIAGK